MSWMTDDDRELALRRLRDSLELHSVHCAKIKDKQGKLRTFIWNKAQRYVHARLEEQLAKTGKVRALVLKGRQQGVSTYVSERFYHKTSMRGLSAFIVAHEDKATSNLFEMAKRYQENNPLAPSTKYSNKQELLFRVSDSGYKLATAGTADVGRSNTAQLIHGSEFGFWLGQHGGRHAGHRDHPGVDGQRPWKRLPPDVAGGGGGAWRVHRHLRSVVLAGGIPRDGQAGLRAERC
jgi:hypothetical protein